jgi:hypothetical protein
VSLDIKGLLNAVRSHAMASARFERSAGSEPRHPPGHGLTLAVWPDLIRPAQSGMASTSALVVFKIRLYSNAAQEPADEIDPVLVEALDDLLGRFQANFRLGLDNVRCIDVFGSAGVPLKSQAGWLDMSDGSEFRIVDIDLPVIVNDCWEQVA